MRPKRDHRRPGCGYCCWPDQRFHHRSDRVAKYNQLNRIEEALGEKAPYNGRKEIKGQA
ncbi:hypothetical protein ACNKHQ_16030 [Shigella flexneri]